MQKTLLFIILIFTIIFNSCREDLDVNLNTDVNKRLVVDGCITDRPVDDTVRLSWTSDYFSRDTTPYITDATAIISDNENNVFELVNLNNGKYLIDKTQFQGKIGNTYTLTITVNGNEYSATSTMNPVAKMDSVIWHYTYIVYPNMYFYELSYYGYDPPEKNQYMWNIYMNSKCVTDSLKNKILLDDSQFNGYPLNDISLIFYTEEKMDEITGIRDYSITDSVKYIYPDTIQVTIEMMEIPLEYLHFINEVMLETFWKGGLFDGPPANITSNVSNQGVGFFYAASTDYYSFTIIRSEKEKKIKIFKF